MFKTGLCVHKLRLIVLITILLIISCCIMCCSNNHTISHNYIDNDVYNSNSYNSNSGGLAIEFDEGLLLSNIYDGNLYCSSSWDAEKQHVKGLTNCYNLNLSPGGIYYTIGNPGRIYFMDTHGRKKKISGNRVENLMLYDNRLYYRQAYSSVFSEYIDQLNTEVSTLFSCDLNGNQKIIIARNVQEYVICANMIYYIGLEDNSLYRYDISNGERIKLVEKNVWSIAADNSSVFYSVYDSTNNGGALYCTDHSFSTQAQLKETYCTILNMTDHHIFYCTSDDKFVYRMSKDGMEELQILQGNIGNVHIFGDKMLFRRIFGESPLYEAGIYLANLDGSEEVLIFSRD